MEAAEPWRVRDVALLLACGFGVWVLVAAGAQAIFLLQEGPQALPAQSPAMLTMLAVPLFYLVILVGVWVLVVFRYKVPWSVLGLRWPRRSSLPPLALLCLLLLLGSALIVVSVPWLLDLLGQRPQLVLETALPPRADPLFGVVLLAVLVLVPVAEELLWRGILYQALRKRIGIALAVVGSALVFTIVHQQLTLAPEMLLLGIVLAIAFEQTRSLYPSMLINAIYNGVIILFTLRGA